MLPFPFDFPVDSTLEPHEASSHPDTQTGLRSDEPGTDLGGMLTYKRRWFGVNAKDIVIVVRNEINARTSVEVVVSRRKQRKQQYLYARYSCW